jgi:hypothetical protein
MRYTASEYVAGRPSVLSISRAFQPIKIACVIRVDKEAKTLMRYRTREHRETLERGTRENNESVRGMMKQNIVSSNLMDVVDQAEKIYTV